MCATMLALLCGGGPMRCVEGSDNLGTFQLLFETEFSLV